MIKRAEFIGNAVKVRENFSFAHPAEIINATEKYCSSHHGSSLWDLRGPAAESLYSSWNTNLKLIWNLPRNCHTYFIESVLAPGILSPRVTLMSRFLSFFHSLLSSPSTEVQVLSRLSAHDLRTTLGSNLAHAQAETGLDPWCYGGQRMKDELFRHNKSEVPPSDEWRLPLLEKLLFERLVTYYESNEGMELMNTQLQSLVTN